jgi:hypothetical protein
MFTLFIRVKNELLSERTKKISPATQAALRDVQQSGSYHKETAKEEQRHHEDGARHGQGAQGEFHCLSYFTGSTLHVSAHSLLRHGEFTHTIKSVNTRTSFFPSLFVSSLVSSPTSFFLPFLLHSICLLCSLFRSHTLFLPVLPYIFCRHIFLFI